MAFARDTYTGVLAQDDYTITFPYLDETHIEVTIDAAAQTLGVDFTITTTVTPGDTVTLTVPSTGGEAIVITRNTPNASLVSFTGGTPVTESNMSTVTTQLQYLVEELSDYVDVATA